jgi:hypothetical protein
VEFGIGDFRLTDSLRSQIQNPKSQICNSLLPAALLATLLILTSSLSAFGAEASKSELKWRRPSTTSAAKNRLRDRTLKLVAHEENIGPVLRVADEGARQYQSIVAPAESNKLRGTQVAQQPADTAPNVLEREIEEPFELPQVDDPATEPEPMPEPSTEPMPLPTDPTLEQPVEQPLSPPTTQPQQPVPDPFDRNQEDTRLPDPAPDEPTSLAEEKRAVEENCQDELDKLRANTLDKIGLQIAITGTPGEDFPLECTVDDGSPFSGRCWSEVTYMWKASALCHKPLYFECEQMERYGHSWGPVADPLIAGAHFFSRLPVLPYCMGITPPNECVYALGHYRPGSCAPYMIDPIPFTCRAAVNQAAFTVGMVYFLPAGVTTAAP